MALSLSDDFGFPLRHLIAFCDVQMAPDAAIDWYDVWLGVTFTAVLFELGKYAIGFYIGKQGLETTYGAAASIIAILIWVYYSSQIILMGAEVTHTFAKLRGSIKNREKSDHSSGDTQQQNKLIYNSPISEANRVQ